jgi:hypothetical protein
MSVARNVGSRHGGRAAPRPKFVSGGGGFIVTKVTQPKHNLRSSPVEDVRFKVNIHCDVEWFLWNEQAYDELSGNKDW